MSWAFEIIMVLPVLLVYQNSSCTNPCFIGIQKWNKRLRVMWKESLVKTNPRSSIITFCRSPLRLLASFSSCSDKSQHQAADRQTQLLNKVSVKQIKTFFRRCGCVRFPLDPKCPFRYWTYTVIKWISATSASSLCPCAVLGCWGNQLRQRITSASFYISIDWHQGLPEYLPAWILCSVVLTLNTSF